MQETTTENTTGSTPVAPRTDRLEVLKELSRGSIGVVRQARNPQYEEVTRKTVSTIAAATRPAAWI